MEDKDIVQDLRDRLIVIETLIKNIPTNMDLKMDRILEITKAENEKLRIEMEKLKAENDEKNKVQNHRISNLEDNQTYLVRTVAGFIITIVTGIILFFINK